MTKPLSLLPEIYSSCSDHLSASSYWRSLHSEQGPGAYEQRRNAGYFKRHETLQWLNSPFLGCPSVIVENILFPWGLCCVQGLFPVFSNSQCLQLHIPRGNPGKVELWFPIVWHHRPLGPCYLEVERAPGQSRIFFLQDSSPCPGCFWIWPGEVSLLLPFILTSHSLLLMPFIYSLTQLAPLH